MHQLFEDQLPTRKPRKLRPGAFWDRFYLDNRSKFFKDRHYLHKEFPLLLQTGGKTFLELGCGVGNTTFPLARLNPEAYIYSCDYSEVAVKLLKDDQEYNPRQISAFVADITGSQISSHVPAESVDIATAIFVLSAIAPQTLCQAISELKKSLKPGTGTVFVRDYAAGDLAEIRFCNHGSHRVLGEHFYSRGDGTWSHFFTKESLCQPFVDAGFTCLDARICTRKVINRASGEEMSRRWIQAVFCLPPGPPRSLVLPEPGQSVLNDVVIEATIESDFYSDSAFQDSAECSQFYSIVATHCSWASKPSEAKSATSETENGGSLQLTDEEFLSEWLRNNTAVCKQRIIVDMGSGDSGLCGLAALNSCRMYIYVCPSIDYMQCLQQQLKTHAHKVVCERLRVMAFHPPDPNILRNAFCQDVTESPDTWIMRLKADFSEQDSVLALLLVASTYIRSGGLLILLGVSNCVNFQDLRDGDKGSWSCFWDILHYSNYMVVVQSKKLLA